MPRITTSFRAAGPSSPLSPVFHPSVLGRGQGVREGFVAKKNLSDRQLSIHTTNDQSEKHNIWHNIPKYVSMLYRSTCYNRDQYDVT